MRIYISKDGDTLEAIAKKYSFSIEELYTLNLHICDSHTNIGPDIHVLLPPQLPTGSPAPYLSSPHHKEENYLDHWIPLTPVEQMSQTDYDVIIVGSGAGGGAALWRLCEQWGDSGKRIGMIEAGGLVLPTHGANVPTLAGDRLSNFNDAYYDHIGNYLPDFPNVRVMRALGGRTLFWARETPRIHPSYFKYWPFPYSDLVPYYQIAEQIMTVNTSYTAGSAVHEILLNRVRMNGFPDAATIPLAVDLQVTQFGQVHSNFAFSSIEFLAYALNARPFDLAVNTRAVQIATENGKVSGIKAMTKDKKSYNISAKTVIVCASTIETPRVLLNSDIPGVSIGKYLIDHSFVRATATANRNAYPEVIGASRIYVSDSVERKFQLLAVGPDYNQQFAIRPVAENIDFAFHTYGTVEPRFENRVYLNPTERDSYGVPLVCIDFSYSHQDKVIIEQMHAATSVFMSAMGLSTQQPPDVWPPGSLNHEAGTCRMGDDPATSATNRYGQVHGISGLYVADNSVLPQFGGANPTLSTVALAIRTADYIIETLK